MDTTQNENRRGAGNSPGGKPWTRSQYTAPDPRGQPPTQPEIESALAALDPGCERQTWFTVAAALRDGLGDQAGFPLFDSWSRGGASYNLADTRDTWRSIREGGGIGIKSLFKLARDAGWRWEPERSDPRNRATTRPAHTGAYSARPAPTRPIPQSADDQRARERLIVTWRASVPLDHSDAEPVRRYLIGRGLGLILADLPGADVVRFHPNLVYWDGRQEVGRYPALVSLVQDMTGRAVTLHRTYLTPNGRKADVPSSKKLMTPIRLGAIRGAAVRLYAAEKYLGVAEGLETSLAIRLATGQPVWSTVTAGGMAALELPPEIRELFIWCDLDSNGVGQQAAEGLARRMTAGGRIVRVMTPPGEIPAGAKGPP
ncbi:MAG: PriCT-2 domain-containing protein [Magnetococcales bacterium]|nr:PriCT-2 domain-containing protein [Magnetococcales bacterium]